MGLNVDQQRVLAAHLRHLERSVEEMEALLEGPHEAVLERTVVLFSAEQCAAFRTSAAAIRREIAAIAAAFALPVVQRDGGRIVDAAVASAMVGLEEVRPARLAGYGPVDTGAVAPLDAALDRLGALLAAIRIANEGTVD